MSHPTAAQSTVNYDLSMALSAHRRELAHMEAVFKRFKDVDGGLSKSALISALKEVGAPVLSSSDGASEDSLFRRADTNLSGYVDQNEYFFQPTFSFLPVTPASCAGSCSWQTCPTTSKCSSPITT